MKLLSLEPESSASANSATAAYKSDEAFVKTPSPFGMVRETGLEPVRDYHTPLKRARLPIPPLSHDSHYYSESCGFCQSLF